MASAVRFRASNELSAPILVHRVPMGCIGIIYGRKKILIWSKKNDLQKYELKYGRAQLNESPLFWDCPSGKCPHWTENVEENLVWWDWLRRLKNWKRNGKVRLLSDDDFFILPVISRLKQSFTKDCKFLSNNRNDFYRRCVLLWSHDLNRYLSGSTIIQLITQLLQILHITHAIIYSMSIYKLLRFQSRYLIKPDTSCLAPSKRFKQHTWLRNLQPFLMPSWHSLVWSESATIHNETVATESVPRTKAQKKRSKTLFHHRQLALAQEGNEQVICRVFTIRYNRKDTHS